MLVPSTELETQAALCEKHGRQRSPIGESDGQNWVEPANFPSPTAMVSNPDPGTEGEPRDRQKKQMLIKCFVGKPKAKIPGLSIDILAGTFESGRQVEERR